MSYSPFSPAQLRSLECHRPPSEICCEQPQVFMLKWALDDGRLVGLSCTFNDLERLHSIVREFMVDRANAKAAEWEDAEK